MPKIKTYQNIPNIFLLVCFGKICWEKIHSFPCCVLFDMTMLRSLLIGQKKSRETHTTLPFHPNFQLGVTENTHTNSMVVTWNLLHILVWKKWKKESFYMLGPNPRLEMGMVHFISCVRVVVYVFVWLQRQTFIWATSFKQLAYARYKRVELKSGET